MISAEQLQTAREHLFLGLSAFANDGLNLWCINTHTLSAEIGKAEYVLPAGVQDILNPRLREGTFTDATLALSEVSYTFDDDTAVASLSLLLPAGAAEWVLESSEDGVTWQESGAYEGTLEAAGYVNIDASPRPAVRYWRGRQTLGTDTPTSARFVWAERETPFAPMARDDYMALPNKYASGRPLQYWLDKRYGPQRFVVWQVPSTLSYQFVLTTQDLVQDVGDLTNELAVPARWLDAIISDLAVRTYLELPKQSRGDVSLADLQGIASGHLSRAANSESDGGPSTFTPRISVYTR